MRLVALKEAKYQTPEVLTLVGDYYEDDFLEKENMMIKVRIIDEDHVGRGRSRSDSGRVDYWVRIEDRSPEIKHNVFVGNDGILRWKSGNNWYLFPPSDEEYWNLQSIHMLPTEKNPG